MKLALDATPPPPAPTPPVDSTRAYHLRAQGQTWGAIAARLDCTTERAKHAATRYANAHAVHVFG